MFKAWFGAEVMNYVKFAIVPNRGIEVWRCIYVTRISLVLEHLLLQCVCLIHHTSVFVPFQFRWPWRTALPQTEPVRTPTPSLTAGRPMLTWLISEPSHGWCSQVRPDMMSGSHWTPMPLLFYILTQWLPINPARFAWQTADAFIFQQQHGHFCLFVHALMFTQGFHF